MFGELHLFIVSSIHLSYLKNDFYIVALLAVVALTYFVRDTEIFRTIFDMIMSCGIFGLFRMRIIRLLIRGRAIKLYHLVKWSIFLQRCCWVTTDGPRSSKIIFAISYFK